jgi:NAD-dependent dihydropyrimidine dehydrogenase PreA subunit
MPTEEKNSPLSTIKRPSVLIHAEQCKGCGRCVAVCPKGVLTLGTQHNRYGYRYAKPQNPDNCIGCGTCFYACPEPGAVTVYRKEKKEDK